MNSNEINDKDLTIERRAKIIEEIEQNGNVQVHLLSKMFRVSPVTIRNDLSHLEQKNLLIRTRGGAIRPQQVAIDYKLNLKAKKHFPEKQAIGKKAAELINEGETIILDSGTTTFEVAKNLGEFNDLTIITNALNVAGALIDFTNIKVIVPGGTLRRNSLSLIGAIAEQSIQDYYCDKLFIGVDGIDTEHGISTPNAEEAHLNKLMIKNSKEVIVVTDSSKFLKRSFVVISGIEDVDTIITDNGIPDEEYKKLVTMGKNVVLV